MSELEESRADGRFLIKKVEEISRQLLDTQRERDEARDELGWSEGSD